MDFDAAAHALWDAYSAARAKQINRWLQTAREMRGAEFTDAKATTWLQAELDKDTRFRLGLNLQA